MLSGLYAASTALHAAELSHEVIARNLAHSNVPGFRRAIASFETFEPNSASGAPDQNQSETLGTQLQDVRYDFQQGPIQRSGRALDVAINGDGFFELEGPNGPLYTRSGVFFLGDDGTLVNTDGIPVLGEGGPISIPAGASPNDVELDDAGRIQVKGFEVGQLKLVSFADNGRLVPEGTTSFRAPPDLVLQPSEAKVLQGGREMSNVSSVHELVRMIAGMRHYEASQKALRTIGDSIHQVTDPNAE